VRCTELFLQSELDMQERERARQQGIDTAAAAAAAALAAAPNYAQLKIQKVIEEAGEIFTAQGVKWLSPSYRVRLTDDSEVVLHEHQVIKSISEHAAHNRGTLVDYLLQRQEQAAFALVQFCGQCGEVFSNYTQLRTHCPQGSGTSRRRGATLTRCQSSCQHVGERVDSRKLGQARFIPESLQGTLAHFNECTDFWPIGTKVFVQDDWNTGSEKRVPHLPFCGLGLKGSEAVVIGTCGLLHGSPIFLKVRLVNPDEGVPEAGAFPQKLLRATELPQELSPSNGAGPSSTGGAGPSSTGGAGPSSTGGAGCSASGAAASSGAAVRSHSPARRNSREPICTSGMATRSASGKTGSGKRTAARPHAKLSKRRRAQAELVLPDTDDDDDDGREPAAADALLSMGAA